MNTREKVILGICGAAVAWAAVVELPEILFPSEHSDNRSVPTDVVNELRTVVQAGQLTNLDRHMLNLVSEIGHSSQNPFVSPEEYREIRERAGSRRTAEALPKYVGFFRIADLVFAIIDGVEYRVGEELNGADYRVVEIQHDQVQLVRGSGHERVTLNLEPDN
ncbi:MAG: hypothetical protein JJU20_02285 [Opitutales bacterium]|nr:hypothetical protein [Opitutales bacterium]